MNERHTEFYEAWEKPVWGSLEEVYERAGLSTEETAALDKYRSVAEYYLLRAKTGMVTGLAGTPVVRRLAGYMRFLNSDCVHGVGGNDPPRRFFVGELFGDTRVHKPACRLVTRRSESGETEHGERMRIRAWSTAFWDKLAELQVLAFFCANGHEVQLPPRNSVGRKPEFFVQAAGAPLGVEVKNLDTDAVLDLIFGDGLGFGATAGELPEPPENYARIVDKVNDQYRAASGKFVGTPGLVFILVPTRRGPLTGHLDKWREQLVLEWRDGRDPLVVGVVLVLQGSVEVLVNPSQADLMHQLEFPQVNLNQLRGIYEACDALDLWPT